MLTRVLTAVVAVASLVALGRPASACGCVDWPPERRMTEADIVFLGRTAEKPMEDAGAFTHFTVIETLKGTPQGHMQLARHPDDDCERTFQRGELALVFVVKGKLPVCAGNVDIDALMPSMGQYLGHEQPNPPTPGIDALKLALAGKVKGSKQSVYAPGLAGKTVKIGSTQVSFVDKKSDELTAVSGVSRGSLTYVALRDPDNVAYYALVGRERGKSVVLASLRKDLKIK
jgi:hypothetical protein